MNRLLILSTVSILMTTSANANHPDECDPSDEDCACHFEQDITKIEIEKLLEQLPLKNEDCVTPLVDDSKQQSVSVVTDGDDNGSDSNNDNDDNGSDSNDNGSDGNDNGSDSNDDNDDRDNGHGNDHDKHDSSNPGKGHGHGRDKS